MNKIIAKIIAITFLGLIFIPSIALADQYDDYIAAGQYHNIISNEHFVDKDSMTVEQIQTFLNTNNSWIKDYVDNSEAGRGRSAAQIIWDAAHGKYEASGTWNGITVSESTGTVSPKVILVFLQKEQSLISNPNYNEWAMIASMGYNCYAGVLGDLNNNNCKDIYEGFTKQVENGAWQLRYNYEAAGLSPSWWASTYPELTPYYTGNTVTMGTSRTPPDNYQVTLTNQATASCYRYTPYVFYGNYNVWNLFYNLYFPGSVATPIGSNDTSVYSLVSYNGFLGLKGSKVSSDRVFIDSNLIADSGSLTWSISSTYNVGEYNILLYYVDSDGNRVGEKKIYFRRQKMADINFDNSVDVTDLAIFAENWGRTNPVDPMADLNGDRIVDITDLAIFADSWGK